MINLKTQAEVAIMREGGVLLTEILTILLQKVKVGVSTKKLDELAYDLIKQTGGKPSFQTVKGYRWSTCMCVNDEVVHGIPDDYLKPGDILCIDIGLLYKGFHTDTAWTVKVSEQNLKINQAKEEKIDRFLKVGQEALAKAVSQAKAGYRVGHISWAIQTTIESQGYSVVKSLVGHGIGRKLHEEPQIPGFLDRKIEETPLLEEGMTLAIEVIYNEGKDQVVYKNNDGWTIVTKDGSLSAVFEQTVLVGKEKPLVLTKKPI